MTEKGEGDVARIIYSERKVGCFERQFTFPTNIDADKPEAKLSEGVLYIKILKAKHTTSVEPDILQQITDRRHIMMAAWHVGI